jgi:large subunit ribosomal protein L18
MNTSAQKTIQKNRRHARVRAKVSGTASRPRLAVFRSNRFVYAQIINDEIGVTLASADSRTSKAKSARERAKGVGAEVAAKAKEKGVTAVVFDRGGFTYQGVISALAEGAREAGLTF